MGMGITPSQFESEAVFDPAPLQELADLGGAEMVESVVDVFDDAVVGQLQAVIDALQGDDPRLLRGVAHRLKGSAGTVGAVRLSSVCQHLEKSGADGHVPDGITATYLNAELAQLQQAMKAWSTQLK